MTDKLMITIQVDPSVTLPEMVAVGERFDCIVKESKEGRGYWDIETNDPANLFWLGMNFNQFVNQ